MINTPVLMINFRFSIKQSLFVVSRTYTHNHLKRPNRFYVFFSSFLIIYVKNERREITLNLTQFHCCLWAQHHSHTRFPVEPISVPVVFSRLACPAE